MSNAANKVDGNIKNKVDHRMGLSHWLVWALYSRIAILRKLGLIILKRNQGEVFTPSDSAVRMLVGRDVCFDQEIRNIGYLGAYRLKEKPEHLAIMKKIWNKYLKILWHIFLSPRLFSPTIGYPFQELLVKKSENIKRRATSPLYERSVGFNIDVSRAKSKYSYPFEKMATLMKSKHLVFVNLETPLTTHTRAYGFFISEPNYAQAMKEAGISVVSLANNHVFDAGEIGFVETMENLRNTGISYVGAGNNFDEARAGRFLEIGGIRLAFLGYTQFCIHRYTSIAAEYPGILPLDRDLIIEDIQSAKEKADYVFVS